MGSSSTSPYSLDAQNPHMCTPRPSGAASTKALLPLQFPGFDLIAPLGLGAATASWSAVTSGNRQPNTRATHVVKLCHPDPEMLGADSAQSIVQQFAAAAVFQQVTAARGASRWASIQSVKESQDRALMVMAFFPNTALKLIRGRILITEPQLRQIILEVVRGLEESHRLTGRGHGNIKAGNVLICSGSALEDCQIRLTDPAPPRRKEFDDLLDQDLASLGRLIYQLVTHAEPSTQALAGGEGPNAWSKLGKPGKQWCQLCDRLLNPYDRQAITSLSDLQKQVGGMVGSTRRFSLFGLI